MIGIQSIAMPASAGISTASGRNAANVMYSADASRACCTASSWLTAGCVGSSMMIVSASHGRALPIGTRSVMPTPNPITIAVTGTDTASSSSEVCRTT